MRTMLFIFALSIIWTYVSLASLLDIEIRMESSDE